MKTITIINIIIFILILSLGTGEAGRWTTPAPREKYYRDEYSKTILHLGIGGAYGGTYYLTFENNDNYAKYMTTLRISQEKAFYRLGFVYRFNFLMESEEFTDERTFFSERDKKQFLNFIGADFKLPSSLPFIESYNPYLLLGGGFASIDYHHMFMDENRILYDHVIEGSGWNLGVSLGAEIQLMKDFFSLDFGINYLLANLDQRMRQADEGSEIELEQVEGLDEIELHYYAGFIVNLF